MNSATPVTASPAVGIQNEMRDTARRYHSNFPRHLIGISRYMQTRMMRTLREQHGHADLRLGFAPYITLLDHRGQRLSDLAQTLGISKQACNQAVKPIEAAGYIERKLDPKDGRARILTLSSKGRKLRRDGIAVVQSIDTQFTNLAGDSAIADASGSLGKLYTHLALGLVKSSNSNTHEQPLYGGLGGLLPRLSDYTMQQLMELTKQRGHSGLKLSYGQVLSLIGPEGGRIGQMAEINDVSKQAISATATELESLGYLCREPDPNDARHRVLQFTPQGNALIADSVLSVEALEAEFAQVIGPRALKRLSKTLLTLFEGLQIEQEKLADTLDSNLFETTSADLPRLAQQLKQQLGEQASQSLATLLLHSHPTGGNNA